MLMLYKLKFIAFFIRVQGFIDIFFLLDIMRSSDVFLYGLFFCNSLFIFGCFFCMVSLMGLVYARYAYLEKDSWVFLYSIVLSIVVCLSGLILIKCGLDAIFEWYILCGTSSTEPTGGWEPGGQGYGDGNGNGNGNGGTNTDGWGGEHRSDQDEEAYNQRKLQYLKSELNKYELTTEEAKHRLSILRGQKSQKIITDATYAEKKHYYEQIINASKTRSKAVESWIQAHENNKPYLMFKGKRFEIDTSDRNILRTFPWTRRNTH